MESSVNAPSGARGRATFALAASLFTLLSWFVVVQSLRDENPHAFVAEKPATFRVLADDALTFTTTAPAPLVCSKVEDCLTELRTLPATPLTPLVNEGDRREVAPFGDATRLILVRFTARPNNFATPYTGVSAVLALPRLRFQQADVLIDGARERRFFSGERVTFFVNSWR